MFDVHIMIVRLSELNGWFDEQPIDSWKDSINVVKGTLPGGTCYVAKRAGSTPVYYTRAKAHKETKNPSRSPCLVVSPPRVR